MLDLTCRLEIPSRHHKYRKKCLSNSHKTKVVLDCLSSFIIKMSNLVLTTRFYNVSPSICLSIMDSNIYNIFGQYKAKAFRQITIFVIYKWQNKRMFDLTCRLEIPSRHHEYRNKNCLPTPYTIKVVFYWFRLSSFIMKM